MFNLKFLSPQKTVVSESVESVVLPGVSGQMEIMETHTPMIAELEAGAVTVKRKASDVLELFITGGYANVSGKELTVLADSVEFPKDIDRVRAEKSLSRATERLNESLKAQHKVDVARALYARKKAQQRLDLLSKNR